MRASNATAGQRRVVGAVKKEQERDFGFDAVPKGLPRIIGRKDPQSGYRYTMGMSEIHESPWRRIHFAWNLKFVFGVVAIAAVLFWFVWDFYPRWRIQPRIEALATEDSDKRQLAAQQVLQLGDAAIPFLMRGLNHDNKWVRWEAATLLGQMADADTAIPALIKALDDPDADVPKRAAAVIGEFGPSAETAVPALTKALQHREKYVRVRAADALGLIGPKATQASASLTNALRDRDGEVRIAAALALWRVTGEQELAVAALVEQLRYGDARRLRSSEAARALGAMGKAASDAIPALRTLIADQANAYTHQFAVEALKTIEPTSLNP